MLVAYIDEYRAKFGVAPICQVLTKAGTRIAPSTSYAAKTRPASARSISDAATTEVICRVHAENYGVYGVRKVHAELRRQGHRVARCTVHRLMKGAGLRGISRAQGPRTTIPGAGPDMVQRAFSATAPGQLWVADITAAPSAAGSMPPSSSTCSRAGSWDGNCPSRCAPTWPWTPWRWACGPVATKATTSAA